jgi:hypothetical protein
LFTAHPDHFRTFDPSNDTSGPTIKFVINRSFSPNAPIVTLQAGQVEQWLLVNTSPIDHASHIHQTNFAVISVNSIPVSYRNPFTDVNPYPYVSLRDTVEILPGGSVVIRFRVSPELGKYVFHCHILEHEDGGMMTAVLAIPNHPQRARDAAPRAERRVRQERQCPRAHADQPGATTHARWGGHRQRQRRPHARHRRWEPARSRSPG